MPSRHHTWHLMTQANHPPHPIKRCTLSSHFVNWRTLLKTAADLCCFSLLAGIPPLHTVHTPHPGMKPRFMCKWRNPDVMSKWQLERILHAHIPALNITTPTHWRKFPTNMYITHCLWGSPSVSSKKHNHNHQVNRRTPKMTLKSKKVKGSLNKYN